MKCLWEDMSGTVDARGWRRVRCVREGCEWQKGIAPTWRPFNQIHAECTGKPRDHREGVALFREAFGVSEAQAICWYIQWKADGAKQSELPRVMEVPLNKGETLTADELAELRLTDPTLAGNRLEALFKAINIPTCGGCESRRDWLNKAHEWLRGN